MESKAKDVFFGGSIQVEGLKENVAQRYWVYPDIGVSKNSGTPKSSILVGFSIKNHPFWGTSIFLETPI